MFRTIYCFYITSQLPNICFSYVANLIYRIEIGCRWPWICICWWALHRQTLMSVIVRFRILNKSILIKYDTTKIKRYEEKHPDFLFLSSLSPKKMWCNEKQSRTVLKSALFLICHNSFDMTILSEYFARFGVDNIVAWTSELIKVRESGGRVRGWR